MLIIASNYSIENCTTRLLISIVFTLLTCLCVTSSVHLEVVYVSLLQFI